MTRAERLRSALVEDRIAALQELAATADMTLEELDLVIEHLGDERKALQRRAVDVLVRHAPINSVVLKRVEETVSRGTGPQRWGGVFALSRFTAIDRAALPTLLEALSSKDGDVRWAAADLVKQLARNEAPTVIPALVATARGEDVNQRKMALYILRDLRFVEASDVAVEALSAAAIDVRLAGLAALVALSQDRGAAARRVAVFLDDADARMQRAAAATLGQLTVATEEILAALRRASTASDPSLRRAAEGALNALARDGG